MQEQQEARQVQCQELPVTSDTHHFSKQHLLNVKVDILNHMQNILVGEATKHQLEDRLAVINRLIKEYDDNES